jgi:hypothetical protein
MQRRIFIGLGRQAFEAPEFILGSRHELLFADGFDDAIAGVAEVCGNPLRIVYDMNKAVEILEKQGMSKEESVEYFEFNILGAYVGERTPIWLTRLEHINEWL